MICFGDEAVDGGLKIDDGMKDAAFEPPACELDEEALDGVELGCRGGREVEMKAEVIVCNL